MTEREPRALTHFDPFEDIDVFGAWSPFRTRSPLWRRTSESQRNLPAVDIAEDDDQYVITAELAGARRDDVTVEMHENVLTIRGEKRSEREDKKEHRRWVEGSYGSFSRSFSLPANAAGDHIKATFDAGVLTIEVPKVPEAKPKVISIR